MTPPLKATKYPTSFILRFTSVDRFLYRFADREQAMHPPLEVVERIRGCMIYFICSRPIVSIVPDSLSWQGDTLIFDVCGVSSGAQNTWTVSAPKSIFPSCGGRVQISEYPHKEVHSFNSDGELIGKTLVSNYIHLFSELPEEMSNHEVLYVGKGTSDCAVDRLDGHSTLEKILSDVLREHPDKEVAILLYNFCMKKDAVQHPALRASAEVQGEKFENHVRDILDFSLSVEDQTLVTEALLIDYFKTHKYNVMFTKGLRRDHATLAPIYRADFDAVSVELDNENIGYLRIFSKDVAPSHAHFALLDVRKNENRLSVFDKVGSCN